MEKTGRKKISIVGFGALLLASSSLISRVLGVFRDSVFSRIFGIGDKGGIFALDAYFAAFRIPDFLYTILIFGAMSAAFIPLYTEILNDNESQASKFASQILNTLLFALIVFSVLFWIFTPYVVPIIAPGLEETVKTTTVALTRIMLLSPIFLGLSSVFQGVENAHKKFVGIALAPIIYNLSIILAAIFFGNQYGVFALAWGVVIGALLHFLVQIPGAMSTGFKYKLFFSLQGKSFRKFIYLTLPRVFGLMVSQVGAFIDTIIASLIGIGSISIFNYALNLQSLPYGVVAVSFSVAIFASLSEKALDEDKSAFLKTMKISTQTLFFWVFPAVLGLFILRKPVVDLILKGGAFTESNAQMTILTLGIFVWAAIAQSFIPFFTRSFYAMKQTKIPVLIALFAVCLNISISLVLTQIYNLEVFALAISVLVSSFFNAVLLILFFAKLMKVCPLNFFNLKKMTFIFLNGSIMGAIVYGASLILNENIYFQLSVSAGIGFVMYIFASKITKTIPSLHEH
ncbi:murein biosynthesis integral membrane protein MurJ [Patescibacteria group bacterium]|nr:murein biosynthesis integral membrane protein MurJ [Patescibacteria group bacterium]